MNNLPAPISPRELDAVLRRPLPVYFSMEEVSAILSANAHDPRAYTVVNALWKTGVRISELLELKRGDLDPYGKSIRVKTLKKGLKRTPYQGVGRKKSPTSTERSVERILVIPDDLVASLLSWLHRQKDEEKIFTFSRPTAYRIVHEACAKAGFKDERAHPHTFRHSFAVHLLREGVPITILKDLLGHSSIQTTLIYLRITQPDIRAVLSRVRW